MVEVQLILRFLSKRLCEVRCGYGWEGELLVQFDFGVGKMLDNIKAS